MTGVVKELQKFYKFAVLDPIKFNYRAVFVSVRTIVSSLSLAACTRCHGRFALLR